MPITETSISNPVSKKFSDTIVFMSAYDFEMGKRTSSLTRKKTKTAELLKRFHIIGLTTPTEIITGLGKVDYSSEYDSINCTSELHFDSVSSDNQPRVDEIAGTIRYLHAAKVLLDEDKTYVKYCFSLESFLVSINNKVYQVDPFAYILNNVLITSFELIHFDNGQPLGIDEIGGRKNNYNILPVDEIKYSDDNAFTPIKKTIPEIISSSIWGLLGAASGNRYEAGSYSFVHNILVLSNNVSSPEECFKTVLGAPVSDLVVSDLGASKKFQYYSKEYLGLVTSFEEENRIAILVDIHVLEAFKTFLMLQMIIDAEVHYKLQDIIDHQIYTNSLFYQSHAPVIVINAIKNLKDTVSYKQYISEIEFKVNALRILQERQRANNGIFLNILLYILAMIGSFQTLEILSSHFEFSFDWGVLTISLIFGLLGMIWLWREYRN